LSSSSARRIGAYYRSEHRNWIILVNSAGIAQINSRVPSGKWMEIRGAFLIT
jgi:hypothetical protein